MEYQEFKEELLRVLKGRMTGEQGYSISVQAQNESEILRVAKPGWKHSAEISCQMLYKIASTHGGEINELAVMIEDTVQEANQILCVAGKMRDVNLKDYESVKNRLRMELVRSEQNGVFLSEGIYEKQAFGALVPYVAVPLHHGIVQTRISPDMLEAYGISQRELMDQAMKNTAASNRAVLLRIEGKKDEVAYIVTGTEKQGGATAILYPGMLEELRAAIENDYFILPASTDTVFAVGKSEGMRADRVKEAFAMIAPTVNPADRLDSRVYEYNGAEKKLSVCKEEKARRMER